MIVSILSLVYNHEPHLKEFFEGLLSQEHPYQWEIVIGIDLSSDNSLEICKKYRDRYPKLIRLIIHEDRVGIIPNFIAVYNSCQGKYIAVCEGDDYWVDKLKLQKQIDLLDQDERAVICFTDIKVYDEEMKSFHPNWATITRTKYCIKDIIKSNKISTCSVLFRGNCVILNPDSFNGLSIADWPLYIQLLNHGYAIYLNEQTAVYRRSLLSSYSKTPVIDQLHKKKQAIEYLLKQPELSSNRNNLMKAYFYHLYAIAIRLKKTDPQRNLYFKVLIRNLSFNNVEFPLKAIFQMFNIGSRQIFVV